MKRIISILLVAVMLSAMLTGCGGSAKRGKASNAEEATKQLKDFKNYDLTLDADIEGNKVQMTYSVRQNGIALSINGKVEGVKADLENVVMIIDNTMYVNIKDIVELAEEQSGEKLPREAWDVIDYVGDYFALGLPKEINIGKMQYKWSDLLRQVVVAAMSEADVDGDTVTIDSKNIDDIAEAVLDALNDGILDAFDETVKELTSIDYMGVVDNMIDSIPSVMDKALKIVEDLADAGIIDEEALEELDDIKAQLDEGKEKIKELKDELHTQIEDALGVEGNKEINKYVADMIDEVAKEAKSELKKELKNVDVDDVSEDFDEEVELNVTADGGVYTIKAEIPHEGDVSIIFKETSSTLKKPEIKLDLGETGGLVVIAGVLAPAYLKYVNKARGASDVSAVIDAMASADCVAADVEFDMREGEVFVIQIEDGRVLFDCSDERALDGWLEIFEPFSVRDDDLCVNYYGIVLPSGAVEWYYEGDTDMLDFSRDFANKFVGDVNLLNQ